MRRTPSPFAGLAPAALDVEAESARLVAADLAFRKHGEKIADRLEGLGIGGRVGPRRAADGRLVDIDHLVDMLHPLDERRGAPGPATGTASAPGRGRAYG